MTAVPLGAAIAVMWAVTYLPRTLPLVLFRREITNRWVRSFLHYVPYAVLTALTLPAIFAATTSWVSAGAGLVVAVVLAWRRRSLLTVALAAAVAVWLVEAALAGL
nr:AzlD domain-containing protein [Propionibacterium sp.]